MDPVDPGERETPEGSSPSGGECGSSITHSPTYQRIFRKRGMRMEHAQTNQTRYRVVNRWVDTLIVNVKGDLPDKLNVKLQHWQNQAKEQEEDVLTPWQFQGCPLAIKPHGSGHGWRWLLYSDDIHLAIGKGTLNQTVCRVTFRSVFLHSRDLGDALSQVYTFLVAFLGYEPALQVSEVHQCADVAGWVLTAADAGRFVSRGGLPQLQEEEV